MHISQSEKSSGDWKQNLFFFFYCAAETKPCWIECVVSMDWQGSMTKTEATRTQFSAGPFLKKGKSCPERLVLDLLPKLLPMLD